MKERSNEELERLIPVLVHIQSHLDCDLSLATVARKGHLSTSHFHRVFSATIGETLKNYVARLRLDRAAFRLLTGRDSVLQIALDAGYNNHETFTRSFARQFRTSPLKYRQQGSRRKSGSGATAQELAMGNSSALSSVRIQEFREIPMAFIRHVGPYERVDRGLWRELQEFTRRECLAVDNVHWGIAHDAPGITPPEKLRFDACVQVSKTFPSSGRIGCQPLKAGLYAVTTHVGSYETLVNGYRALFAHLSKQKRYRIIGLPAVEILHTTQINPAYAMHHTDICIPIERIR
jgi:AraC family transcriptional regulator